MSDYIDIVFSFPPRPTSEFVEVEDSLGASISVGTWIKDGVYWRLRLPDYRKLQSDLDALRAENAKLKQWQLDEQRADAETHATVLRLEAENARLAEQVEKLTNSRSEIALGVGLAARSAANDVEKLTKRLAQVEGALDDPHLMLKCSGILVAPLQAYRDAIRRAAGLGDTGE